MCHAGSRAYARVLSHRRGVGASKRRLAAFEVEDAACMPPSRSSISSSSSLQRALGEHADVSVDTLIQEAPLHRPLQGVGTWRNAAGLPQPVAEQTAPCMRSGCGMPACRRSSLHVIWLCHASLSQSRAPLKSCGCAMPACIVIVMCNMLALQSAISAVCRSQQPGTLLASVKADAQKAAAITVDKADLLLMP